MSIFEVTYDSFRFRVEVVLGVVGVEVVRKFAVFRIEIEELLEEVLK